MKKSNESFSLKIILVSERNRVTFPYFWKKNWIETIIYDGNYLLIYVLEYTVRYPLLEFVWAYVCKFLIFLAQLFGKISILMVNSPLFIEF